MIPAAVTAERVFVPFAFGLFPPSLFVTGAEADAGLGVKVDSHSDRLVIHDQRQRISVLHSVHLRCTEMQFLGQHLQVSADDWA